MSLFEELTKLVLGREMAGTRVDLHGADDSLTILCEWEACIEYRPSAIKGRRASGSWLRAAPVFSLCLLLAWGRGDRTTTGDTGSLILDGSRVAKSMFGRRRSSTALLNCRLLALVLKG